MSTISKVQRNFQITIPAEIRKRVDFHVGDIIDFEVRDEGLLVKPMEVIDRNQAWFWSKEWQENEKKVEEDFRKGKAVESKNLKTFLKELDQK